MPTTHVIGAGVAGLAAAVALARDGHGVTLHEASGSAGGRCRSIVDPGLDRRIDNGNHLLMSGNRDTMRYLEAIGAADTLAGPDPARFPFLDLRTGRRWTLRPNAGPLPWWLLDPRRRVPGTALANYLPGLRLVLSGPDRTVTDCIGTGGALFEKLWEPLAVAVLNTPPRHAAAILLRSVLREALGPGEAACRPRIAKTGLSDTFVEPALRFLERRGAGIRFRHRLLRIASRGDRASLLDFGTEALALRPRDSVVLALPPATAAGLVPDLRVPEGNQPIVNTHFLLPHPPDMPSDLPFLGLIGGSAQWLFVRGDVASVTTSAAGAMIGRPAEAIARAAWNDVAVALGHDRNRLPPWRVVKERRATFSQTPRNARRRPPTRSALANVCLAGDWIDTGLPATIESAIRSGHMAARAIADGNA